MKIRGARGGESRASYRERTKAPRSFWADDRVQSTLAAQQNRLGTLSSLVIALRNRPPSRTVNEPWPHAGDWRRVHLPLVPNRVSPRIFR